MNELSQPFVQIGNRYFPTNAIEFRRLSYSGMVAIYKLGTQEWVADVYAPEATTLIANLNGVSIPLLPDKGSA